MICSECGNQVETWGCVVLCDRCLCARLWRELEGEDYVMLRRRPGGDVWLTSNHNGTRKSTNLTYFKFNAHEQLAIRAEEVFH